MSKKALLKSLLIVVVLFAVVFAFRSVFYHFRPLAEIDAREKDRVLQLAASSLETLDVPVGALLIYNDSILASGFNSVRNDTDVAGHAEINAINNAIRKIGFQSFSKLDRNQLKLISSFEPCMMCKGAILEYNIRSTVFMKGKGIWHWIKNDAKDLRYELGKSKCEGALMQDSLFRLHPAFPGKRD